MTAFYTSPVIIKEMYAKLGDMGMNGGRLLEPSCGIGNFIGMIPGSNTRVTGIELDSLTGKTPLMLQSAMCLLGIFIFMIRSIIRIIF